MAVNLINSNDIEVEQTGQDIQLKTSTPISTIEGNIGNLNLLNTTDKSSVVNAINEVNTKTDIFSTTETLTNKVWIDGKPIYRKAIEINVGTTEVSYSIANNISQAWIDMGNSWCTWGGNRTYPLSRLMAEYYITNDLKLAVKSVSGTNTGYVIVEYTKTS